MTIYGKEYGFKLTVGASADIADLCPDGDLNRIKEVLSGSVSRTLGGTSSFVCAMSRGYEEARSFEVPGYVPDPITPALLRSLDMETYKQAVSEAISAFGGDRKPTVEVEPSKKNGGASAAV